MDACKQDVAHAFDAMKMAQCERDAVERKYDDVFLQNLQCYEKNTELKKLLLNQKETNDQLMAWKNSILNK